MVAAFILVDLARIRLSCARSCPCSIRSTTTGSSRGIDRGLSGVIRGQLVICLINGALTYVGLMLFRVKYPLLLAAARVDDEPRPDLRLDPVVGADRRHRAGRRPGTSTSSAGSMVLAWIIGIHQVEANFLNPKIMGGAAKIHPVLVVFALIAGEHSYGLVGALFAVPVASIIQTMFNYFRRRRLSRLHAPGLLPSP